MNLQTQIVRDKVIERDHHGLPAAGITDVDDRQQVAEAPDDRGREEHGDHLEKKRNGRRG